MSIIYDALTKAQKTIHGEPDPQAKDTLKKSKIKILGLYTVMILLGILIGNAVFAFLNPPLKKSAKTSALKPATVSNSKTQPQTTTRPQPPAKFVLNGIFFSKDEGFALVNNQIVKMGDTVDGALVLKITASEVELNCSGSPVKLTRSK